jgi:hypothetical protein
MGQLCRVGLSGLGLSGLVGLMCRTVYTVVDTVNPLFFVSDAGLSIKRFTQRDKAQNQIEIVIPSTNPTSMSANASNQSSKVIRQLCHPMNQIQRALFKILLPAPSGPYLHGLQVALGVLRLLES